MRTLMLSALAAVALSGSAMGQMVVFNNSSGEFDWEWLIPNDGVPGHHLDITMGPSQDGVSPDRGILYVDNSPITSSEPGYASLWRGDLNIRFAASGYENWPVWNDEYQVNWATSFHAGDQVDASATYQISADLYIYFWNDQAPDGWLGALAAPTESVFIGIELTLDTGVHYGWLELSPFLSTFGNFAGWLPVTWGYNATPGAAAIVPTPSGAALICFAGAAMLRRRR